MKERKCLIMKKVLFALFSLAFAATPALAQTTLDVRINYEPVVFEDTKAYIDDYGNVMLPIRGVCEYLGYTVTWNDENKSINVNKDETNITISTSTPVCTINGSETTIDVPVENIDGRTYMEYIDLISMIDGYMVQYYPEESAVNIFPGDEYTVTADGILDWKGEIVTFEELEERGIPERYIESWKEQVAELQKNE